MNPDSDIEALRERLLALPEEPAPPSLWLRLQVEHARLHPRARPRPQRWRIAAAAVVLLGAPLLLWRGPPPPAALPDPLQDAALRALDRELQLRYLDGASDEQLAPLWDERERLIEERGAAAAQPVPLRI